MMPDYHHRTITCYRGTFATTPSALRAPFSASLAGGFALLLDSYARR